MYRSAAALIVGGAMFVVGCESSPVIGDRSYRASDRTPVDRTTSDDGYAYDSERTTTVTRERGTVNRADVGSAGRVDAPTVSRVDDNKSPSVARVDAAGGRAVQRVDADWPRRNTDTGGEARTASGRVNNTLDSTAAGDAPKPTGASRDAKAAVDAKTTPADPERAAFANTARYPSELSPVSDGKLTYSIDREGKSVKLANNYDRPLRDTRVWVNGTYVALVPELAPERTIVLGYTDFADARGTALGDAGGVRNVQVQTDGKLYDVRGEGSK